MKNLIQSKFFSYGLFWSWNMLYLILFVSLEISTGFVIFIIRDAFLGFSPFEFIITAILAYCVPLVSIGLALTVFRKRRDKLVALFYGVEVPLTLLLLLRLFLVREMHAGTLHLFILFVSGMIVFFYGLVNEKFPTTKLSARFSLILNSILLMIGAYVGLLLIFYLPPSIGGLIKGLAEIDIKDIGEIFRAGFLVVVFMVFLSYSMTLLLGLPVAFFYYYFSSFYKKIKWYSETYSPAEALTITGSFVALNLLVFYLLNWNQPQRDYLTRLNKASFSDSDIKELSKNAEEIKNGLLNAYLSNYRYLGEEEKNDHIEAIYKSAFGGEKSDFKFLQSAHNVFLKPFLYEGKSMYDDTKVASELYEKCFDVSLQKTEREAIKSALKSTWERQGIEAGLLNIDEKKVHVIKQEINSKEQEGIVDVEIHEVYQNNTFEQQEVLYYFSLPEHAVITGVWISDTSEKKFSYRISPRGAAQQVYKEQVRERIDPSLLEQVGPRQYRLRAFPILPKTRIYNKRNITVEDGPEFHLWFSYQLLADPDNTYSLPFLLQKRNVYCDGDTEFRVNSKESDKNNDEDWLPVALPCSQKKERRSHAFALNDSTIITATPEVADTKGNDEKKYSFAFIIDQSYSLGKYREQLEDILESLSDKGYEEADVYLTGQFSRKDQLKSIDMDELVFWGNASQLKMLHQFDSLRKEKKYDGVVLLTDQGDYEISEDSLPSLEFNFPVYLIHMDGKLPYAYDDDLMETIVTSRGKSYLSINDLFQQKQLERKYNLSQEYLLSEQGYLWKVTKGNVPSQPHFEKLATRQYISMNKPAKGQSNLSNLDIIHALAMKAGIVTRFSSMIVLVNDTQHKRLDEMEQKEDRFKREVEDGKEVLSTPMFKLGEVSGTPEPEEWLLIIVACGIIMFILYSRYKGEIYKIIS